MARVLTELLKGKGEKLASLKGNGWKVNTLPKIQCFIWKCYLHSLPVKELLVARGIAENGVCEYCGLGSESIIHVLRDCSFAKNFWTNLNNTLCDEDFFRSELCDWLKCNLKDSKDLAIGQTPWDVQFAFVRTLRSAFKILWTPIMLG
ncbi:putative ribonuclease h protein [Quercus suber]|uniref:Ribonuclease h protein n=1 Tax=Quercus suber TaxID=58331 RepID=A0AAW0J2R4_QUESU